jgi:hypothetical protein
VLPRIGSGKFGLHLLLARTTWFSSDALSLPEGQGQRFKHRNLSARTCTYVCAGPANILGQKNLVKSLLISTLDKVI